jgi:hypothetical protein
MSNLDAYPTRESEASSRARVANKVRHAGISIAGMSLLSTVFEVGYRVVEKLPDPLEINSEVKGSLIAFSSATAVAASSALYETMVRHHNHLGYEDLAGNGLSILEPTES